MDLISKGLLILAIVLLIIITPLALKRDAEVAKCINICNEMLDNITCEDVKARDRAKGYYNLDLYNITGENYESKNIDTNS